MGTRALVLGGAGAMGREAVRDLALTSDFDEIVVADREEPSALRLVDELKDRRLSALRVDVTRRDDVEQLMHRADVVGLFNTPRQLELGPEAEGAGVPIVLGCGATPGVTNLMAQAAAAELDSVDRVEIAFGSLRPLAASPGLLDTILEEFSPTTERFYFEDGRFVAVPPFAGARVLEFLPPVGVLETYFVPHSESHTVPRFLDPRPNHVSVRGSWHPEIMKAMRVFLDYGLTSEEAFPVDGAALSPRTFLRAHLLHRPPALDSPVAFFLRVDVTGERDHKSKATSYRSAHPTDWGLAGTARMTGVPMSIALQALARGEVARAGVMGPEAAFSPEPMFAQLRARGVSVERN